MILDFPMNLPALTKGYGEQLAAANKKLTKSLHENSVRRKIRYKKTGLVEYDEFYPQISKPLIDEIDRILARHYGLTLEETDFVINYDIKYRMGLKSDGEDRE